MTKREELVEQAISAALNEQPCGNVIRLSDGTVFFAGLNLDLRPLARAALEAIPEQRSEPSEAMIEAGKRAMISDEWSSMVDLNKLPDAYKAMQAAASPSTEERSGLVPIIDRSMTAEWFGPINTGVASSSGQRTVIKIAGIQREVLSVPSGRLFAVIDDANYAVKHIDPDNSTVDLFPWLDFKVAEKGRGALTWLITAPYGPQETPFSNRGTPHGIRFTGCTESGLLSESGRTGIIDTDDIRPEHFGAIPDSALPSIVSGEGEDAKGTVK